MHYDVEALGGNQKRDLHKLLEEHGDEFYCDAGKLEFLLAVAISCAKKQPTPETDGAIFNDINNLSKAISDMSLHAKKILIEHTIPMVSELFTTTDCQGKKITPPNHTTEGYLLVILERFAEVVPHLEKSGQKATKKIARGLVLLLIFFSDEMGIKPSSTRDHPFVKLVQICLSAIDYPNKNASDLIQDANFEIRMQK